MHPALSVILFTTLSGTGYGLWAWLGLNLALNATPMARTPMLVALAAGFVLVSAGLVASLWHLGQPQRAWRALSQWRSSWLSREGVAAVLTYLPVLLLVWLLWRGEHGVLVRIAGILLAGCSVTTVICTAMIYASLPPVPAWRERAVVPTYLACALLGGTLCSAAAFASFGWHPQGSDLLAPIAIALILAALKMDYWRRIDVPASAPDAADATGLAAIGRVRRFESPHTEPNYLLREMGFVLARRHGARLRRYAMFLAVALPVVSLVMATAWPMSTVAALWFAVLSFQIGALTERWLFFAQARHSVMLYYDPDAGRTD